MITKQVINTLYKKYDKCPKSPDCLDFGLLFDTIIEYHDIIVDIDADQLVINDLNPTSPFYQIPLSKIHAIVPFEEWIAIVLHSSIVFLNRMSDKIYVNIKPPKMSILDKIQSFFSR